MMKAPQIDDSIWGVLWKNQYQFNLSCWGIDMINVMIKTCENFRL